MKLLVTQALIHYQYLVNFISQILPLIGAIVAGNCAVIKPSEISASCEGVLARYLPMYLDKECFQVVCGGVSCSAALLELRWDKIFFTGSPRVGQLDDKIITVYHVLYFILCTAIEYYVTRLSDCTAGKIVMAAAAKHLTPVSLELGGKSPAYIDSSVTDMTLVANRLVWGKFMNTGQTCVAPDYVLCHEKVGTHNPNSNKVMCCISNEFITHCFYSLLCSLHCDLSHSM